jgi:hypothetical protein
MCNMECNACAAAMLTHHFVKQMLDKQLKGAVVFTSSAAAMMPAPFSVMYGSTKVPPTCRPHPLPLPTLLGFGSPLAKGGVPPATERQLHLLVLGWGRRLCRRSPRPSPPR